MNLFFLIIGILLITYVINAVINKKFAIYDSMFWIFATIIIMFLAAFPKSLDAISLKMGVSYSPSLVFLISIVFLLLINFKQSKLLNDTIQKLIDITQELAILKEKVEEMEKNNDNK